MQPGVDGAVDGSPQPGDPTAAELLAATAGCATVVSNGKFATDDDGSSATVDICGATNAVYWTADMDIDCDGLMSTQCRLSTDPDYQDETSAVDSHGDALDAAALPYVVVPSPSSRFRFTDAGLDLGSVVAVIYNDQVEYAVIGDTGPTTIIGEASYATAAGLGIDPDPSTGGTDGPVTYIAFTGDAAHVEPIEDHATATSLGSARAKLLLGR
jgi:hypothetical protein